MTVYYCSIEDIEKQLSTPILIQLTSDNGQDVTNRVVAKEAIIYASALIDGYLRGRYNLPLNTRTCSPALNGVSDEGSSPPSRQPLPVSRFPLLRVLAIDISIYRLYSRRVHNGLPEQIEDAYKNAIATLRDIQKGVVTLQGENDLLETSNFNPDEYRANKTMLDRIFNKRKLSEY